MALLNTKNRIQKLDRIGAMDRRITILQRDISDGSNNEDYLDGWEEIENNHHVWARKESLRGKEVVLADKVQMMYMTVWTIRYRDDLKAEMRIADEYGQVYEILHFDEGESRHRYLDVVTNILPGITWS